MRIQRAKNKRFKAWMMVRAVLVPSLILGLLFPTVSRGESNPSEYASFFTEEVLTVDRERDGILPGTLRTALIQAGGILARENFTMVKIVFAPQVKRIQITKGPLPEIDGSMLTIDCQSNQDRVLIEWASTVEAGDDPAQERHGLVISGNGNTVHGCHLTGFPESGILIKGNRNVIEGNVFGYHKDVPESAVQASGLYEEPKTNGRAGIELASGASENKIQHNDIIANTVHGVLMQEGVGAANTIAYNFFAKNSGQPIKAMPSGNKTPTPTIHRVTQHGETYLVEGTTPSRSTVQIYQVGTGDDEIGMLVKEEKQYQSERFTITIDDAGIVPNRTKLVALVQALGKNTSEFSTPVVAGDGISEIPSNEVPEDSEAQASPDAKPSTNEPESDKNKPDLIIDIQGQGSQGSDPDGGDPRQNETSALGI